MKPDPAIGAQPIQLNAQARARRLVPLGAGLPRMYVLSVLAWLPAPVSALYARLPLTVGDMVPEGTTVDAAAVPLAHATMLHLCKLARWEEAPA